VIGSARSAFNYRRPTGPTLPSAMALYSLNEGAGTTAADTSGNSRTLTRNSTTWTTSGHTGNALTNTTASQGATAGFISPTNTVSISAWVNPLDLTAGGTNFAFGFIDNSSNSDVCVYTQRGDFGTHNVLQGNIRIVGTGLVALNGPALTVGTWAYITMTYDGATALLYKDGSVVASSTATGAIQPGDGFYVAGKNSASFSNTNVVIDDVRVYNPALTAAQVTLAMNTPVT
jgi:hypothetical protein